MSPLKFGFVDAVISPGLVKVHFPADDLLSGPLLVLQQWTKDDKEWNPPAKGEHVACWVETDASAGVVLGAVYSAADAPPDGASESTWFKRFKDGTTLSYDKATKKLVADVGSGTAEVTASKLKVVGDLEVTGKATIGDTLDASGNVSAPDFVAGIITLTGHKHGNGNFGGPTTSPIP